MLNETYSLIFVLNHKQIALCVLLSSRFLSIFDIVTTASTIFSHQTFLCEDNEYEN